MIRNRLMILNVKPIAMAAPIDRELIHEWGGVKNKAIAKRAIIAIIPV